MALPFREQLEAIGAVFTRENGQLRICIGSGISFGSMPSLADLIALGLSSLEDGAASTAVFDRNAEQRGMRHRLGEDGYRVPDPLTLTEFRALPIDARTRACEQLCETYGTVFDELLQAYGSKRRLLDAIGFARFQQGQPRASHHYLAFLLIEGVAEKVVTFNWDLLLERAVAAATGADPSETMNIIKEKRAWVTRFDGPHKWMVKIHGCASQYPDDCDAIILTGHDLAGCGKIALRGQFLFLRADFGILSESYRDGSLPLPV